MPVCLQDSVYWSVGQELKATIIYLKCRNFHAYRQVIRGVGGIRKLPCGRACGASAWEFTLSEHQRAIAEKNDNTKYYESAEERALPKSRQPRLMAVIAELKDCRGDNQTSPAIF